MTAAAPLRTPTPRPRLRIVALAAGLLAALMLLGPAALAHVTITPSTAEVGSTAELTFRVPNEEAKAATTRLTVQLPSDHPVAQLLVKPIPGWKVTVHTTKLATPLTTDDGTFHTVVSQVTWSGGRIEPGQYQDFSLSADPLPDEPTTMVFKALQGYSNGDVVRWIDVPQEGQDEPEHPAPTLTVVKAGAGATDAASSDESSADDMTGMAAGDSGSDGSTGTVVAWIALVVALAAAVLAGVTLWRSQRAEDSATAD